jgi:transcriptional regulator with XRE-family HTH domain
MADEAWQRVATQVRSRRNDRRMSQQELASAAGTTDRLIRSIEKAERTTYLRPTLRAVSEALGWSADSIDRILNGQTPIVLDAPLDASPADLRAEVDRLSGEVVALRAALERLAETR